MTNIKYLLQHSAGNLYWKDREGRYQGANEAFIKLMSSQIPKSLSFIGKTDREIFSSVMTMEKLNIIEQIDQRIMHSGKGECIREEGVDLHGNPAVYITKKLPIFNDHGAIVGVMGTSIDITNEVESEKKTKKMEELVLKSEAKAASEEEMRKTVMVLVGDIIHDLRTPIASIRSAVQLLEELLPPIGTLIKKSSDVGIKLTPFVHPKKMSLLNDNKLPNLIKQAIETMDVFINTSLLELKNAQKIDDEGLVQNEMVLCSSRRIIENTLEAFSFEHPINIHKDSGYDFFLMGNSILIMKILFNLLRNAAEQIVLKDRGEIYIRAKDDGLYNVITIKDTAGGINPELEPQLFEAYFSTKTHGTGIGLFSSKRLMIHFGGQLTFKNDPGQSIEFCLSFPKIPS